MRKMVKDRKTDAFFVQFPTSQGALIRKTAADMEMSPPELIRLCVNTELARKTGDPAAIETLSKMFKEGVNEWIQSRVDFELKKKAHEKK